jgi:uncharacterized membrane protein YraQ (UPF0718 family)
MLQQFVDWLIYGVVGLSAESRIGSAINFFIYDTIKILVLLFLISSLMGIINAYFPIDRLRKYLTTHKMFGLQYFFASLFGAVTPFCSCSSIPLFIGFVNGGIPLGVTFAFLITSPLVNEGGSGNVSRHLRREDNSDLCHQRHSSRHDRWVRSRQDEAGTVSE